LYSSVSGGCMCLICGSKSKSSSDCMTFRAHRYLAVPITVINNTVATLYLPRRLPRTPSLPAAALPAAPLPSAHLSSSSSHWQQQRQGRPVPAATAAAAAGCTAVGE
jgi:hypothetical protein